LRYQYSARDISNRFRTETLDARASGRHVLSSRWWIEHSTSLGIDQTDLREGQKQIRLGTRISATRSVARLTVTPSMALAAYRTGEREIAGLLPTISANFQPKRAKGFVIRSSIARVIRAPTFNERYWVPGGNANLKPEKGWSADFGISFRREGAASTATIETVLFVTELRDKIVWRPGLAGPSIQTWTPDNIGRTWGNGIEASLSIRQSIGQLHSLLARIVHTFSRVEDRSDPNTRSYGNQVRYTPQHVFKSLVSAGSDRLGVDVIFSMTGKRFITSDETQFLRVKREVTIRFRAMQAVAKGLLRLSVAVENAADQAIESIRFYPMPPRNVRVSIVFESDR